MLASRHAPEASTEVPRPDRALHNPVGGETIGVVPSHSADQVATVARAAWAPLTIGERRRALADRLGSGSIRVDARRRRRDTPWFPYSRRMASFALSAMGWIWR